MNDDIRQDDDGAEDPTPADEAVEYPDETTVYTKAPRAPFGGDAARRVALMQVSQQKESVRRKNDKTSGLMCEFWNPYPEDRHKHAPVQDKPFRLVPPSNILEGRPAAQRQAWNDARVTHAFTMQKLEYDPGIEMAWLLLARLGHLEAQLKFHVYLTDLVKEASKSGLNARSRGAGLVEYTTADIFAEMVEGRPTGDRETVAARAGVAKGTFVRFRKRVYDPLWGRFKEYARVAASTARLVHIYRGDRDDGPPTEYTHAGVAGVSAHGGVRSQSGRMTPLVYRS